jgi:hypothetical protein
MADEALSADELRALRVVDLKEKLIQIGLSVAGLFSHLTELRLFWSKI